ncbi:MAG: tetratricopeptide repeat protein [Aphanocapsa lilacina HA4352-LM1]|jgi:tetratricopeptide (TPR) repeat protein|nr:tetratricopeptide repeat protein [Aphanocapsa lilacina HA4352-LM1]
MWNRLFALALVASALALPAAHAQTPLVTVPSLAADQLQRQSMQLAEEAIRLVQVARYSEAEGMAQLAVQLSKNNPQAHTVLGGIYLQNNKPEAALTELKLASELAPDNARFQFNLGLVNSRLKNYPAAATAIERGLKLDPKAVDEYFNLGNTYVLLERPEDAVGAFEKAVALKKTFWEAINNIGLIRYEQGRIDEAKSRWEQAVAINAKAAEPKLALGVALFSQGEREKGLALSEEALGFDKRYSKLDYLKENLWGTKLLADAAMVLTTPRIKAALERLPEPTSDEQAARNGAP